MKIIIAGGTGFIGKALTETLVQSGHDVTLLTRRASVPSGLNASVRVLPWDLFRVGGAWEKDLEAADVVINLAGESIAGKRWTADQKKELLESRIRSVQAIYRALEKTTHRPKVFLNASAVGYYGDRGDEILDENSKPGTGFLSELCLAWEQEVMKAEGLGVRTVRLRIGIVLERGGGALGKMLPAFQLGLGGPLGTGRQWMSWIHRKDLIGLMIYLLENPDAFGAFNATAMNPVRMSDFAKTLGHGLKRPAFFPVPGFALKILLGEMSGILLGGQRVLPQRAIQLGFSFEYPTLESALKAIL